MGGADETKNDIDYRLNSRESSHVSQLIFTSADLKRQRLRRRVPRGQIGAMQFGIP